MTPELYAARAIIVPERKHTKGIPISKRDDHNDLILALYVLLGDIPPHSNTQTEYTETTFVLMFCQTLIHVSKQMSQSGLEYPSFTSLIDIQNKLKQPLSRY